MLVMSELRAASNTTILRPTSEMTDGCLVLGGKKIWRQQYPMPLAHSSVPNESSKYSSQEIRSLMFLHGKINHKMRSRENCGVKQWVANHAQKHNYREQK